MGTTTTLIFDSITFDTTFGLEDGPELWALLSYDNFDEPTPSWTDVTPDARVFSTSRGRDSDLNEFDAGTASLTLDNRGRAYDPTAHTYIRPMIRVWLLSQYNGTTESMFKGYVEAVQQQWPDGDWANAVCVMQAADEFKVLAMDALPNMDPPRDTYADVVAFDNPSNYWRWSDSNLTSTEMSRVTELPTFHWTWDGFVWDTVTSNWTVTGFQDWTIINGVGFSSSFGSSPIAGDLQNVTLSEGVGGYLNLTNAGSGDSIGANDNVIGDPMAGTAFTFETWFQKSGNPGGNTVFVAGPESTNAGFKTWFVTLNTTGTVAFTIRDSGAVNRTVTSATALNNDTWYHLVCELDGANLRIFINGVQDATAGSGSGAIQTTSATGTTMIIAHAGVTNSYMDETCCYLKTALPVARALAHYQAGALRGFRGGTSLGLPHLRAGNVLDAITNDAPRNLRVGTRGMQPVFQHGQDPLTELKKCALVELPNGTLFTAKDGTITLLDAAHRTVSPWNTIQMAFDDDGTGIFYADLVTDFSESFLINEWNASRTGGSLVTSSNAASISTYGKRSQTLSDLPLTQDADVSTITAALLAKYKDPLMRALSIDLDCSDSGVAGGVFALELCDRVRVQRTLPGSGTQFSETVFVQKIEIDGSNDQSPWKVRLGLSDGTAPVGG